jgi:hypothetical protein
MPKFWSESQILSLFQAFGEILEITPIQENPSKKGQCVFIRFASMSQADQAIKSLHQAILPGGARPLSLKWADGEEDRLGLGGIP